MDPRFTIASELLSVVLIAVGSQSAPEKLNIPLQARKTAKRERLPLNEIVVKGLPA